MKKFTYYSHKAGAKQSPDKHFGLKVPKQSKTAARKSKHMTHWKSNV